MCCNLHFVHSVDLYTYDLSTNPVSLRHNRGFGVPHVGNGQIQMLVPMTGLTQRKDFNGQP